jgi:nicotinamidase-related amidase
MQDNQALLVMDVQPGIVDMLSNKEEYLSKLQAAVDHARENKIPVIFVVVGFRQSLVEVSPANKSFSEITKDPERAKRMTEPKPVLEVKPSEPIVTKKRISAFAGSDLEVILRSNNIKHLILTGIATSGVILSTVREAADKDYQLTVLSDLCANTDEEVHRVLLEKVFPRQAEVISSQDWTDK